jgi:hypothetical protein
MTRTDLILRAQALAIEASGLISLLPGEHQVAARCRADVLAGRTEALATKGSLSEWADLVNAREQEVAKLRSLLKAHRSIL